ELIVSDAAVDLTRLNAGAPVVDSHMTYSVRGQMAVVERAWIRGGEGHAEIRFPSLGTDPDADRLFELVRQKIVRNLSVGYTINRVRVVEPQKAGDVERRIVESWTPYELSFVTVPADAGAQARSAEHSFPLEIVGRSAVGGSGAAGTLARMKMRARAAGL
ncbi:HK97 family phage prohead protease, partial [Methylobacterium gnaphalii]